MTKKDVDARVTRRKAVGEIFTFVGGAAALFACGGSTASSGGAGTDSDGGSGTGTGTSDGSSTSTGTTGSATAWATGGTKSMSGGYADPFPTAVAACVLATAATEGPCTEAADQVRSDVSEGYSGLPVRLALEVVDASCTPIAGAKVKIWHTQLNGSYSGNTPNNGMCLKDQADSAKHYFRGVQTSDAAGRVDFDTCFPGWYRGRTIHIHYSVTANGRTFTSQLVFEQSLVSEIFSTHPEYKGFGQPDTTNASDNVVGGHDLTTYTLEVTRQADGAMLAAKQLVVP